MKPNRRNCLVIGILGAGVGLVALLILIFAFYIGPNLVKEKRAEIGPPTIIVHTPDKGDEVPEGDLLTASATATSRNPIARMEVWLNGVKNQEQVSQGDENTFYASFEIDMTEGSHILVFRAIDNNGLVGQSLPIPITGTRGLAILTTEDGQTLEEIADALGANPDELRDLNPGMGNDGLPGGTNVNVPRPPAQPGDPDPGQPPDGGQPKDKPPDPPPDTTKAYEVLPIQSPVISIGNWVSTLLSIMPQAPTSFFAEYKDCVVQLHWYDEADNETHFNIWMQRDYGPPQLIATTPDNPLNGPTTYKFKSPLYGFYSFWVEAANSIAGQPSEIKQVFVSDPCKSGIATTLEIEALDMYIFESYNDIYCYLSVDGTEYKLIPESGYIQVQNNWGDITKHWGGEKRILFPMPEDEELTLEGHCYSAISPLMISPFTTFNTSVPREKWDGSRLEIKTDAFLIGYRVQPFGPEKAQGAFHYVNYGLNPPEIWNVEAEGELEIPEKDWKARTVTLTWHWEGNPDELNSFLILIDGKEFRHVSKIQRQESILMGSACGQEYSFEMIAIGPGGARSVPSTAKRYQQPPCPVMAEVRFLTVISNTTDDTDCIPPLMWTCLPYTGGSCDALGVYYDIWVMGAGHKKVKIRYGNTNNSFHYQCGIEYRFSNQLSATQDAIIVPVDPSSPEIRFGTIFWEEDGPSDDDKFGETDERIHHDYDDWPTVSEVITLHVPMMNETADATIKVRVSGYAYPGP
jgi:hypothetical protein